MRKQVIAASVLALMWVGQVGAADYSLLQSSGSNGSVQLLADGFVLTGSDFGDPDATGGLSFQSYYSKTFAVDTLVSFSWSYASTDALTTLLEIPGADWAGYTIWGSSGTAQRGMINLSDDATAVVSAAGTVNALAVRAGENFGWFINSSDGLNGSASLTVTGLTEIPVAAVPEPTTYAMLLAGLGLLGGVARKRRIV